MELWRAAVILVVKAGSGCVDTVNDLPNWQSCKGWSCGMEQSGRRHY